MFSIIPIIIARETPLKSKPDHRGINNPPIPQIKITEAIKVFFVLCRFTFDSSLRPLIAIKPYNTIAQPPNTQ